jgi:hypothetical protein
MPKKISAARAQRKQDEKAAKKAGILLPNEKGGGGSPISEAPQLVVPQKHQATNRVVDYNDLELTEEHLAKGMMTIADVEMKLAKRFGTRLSLLYPGIDWEVMVDSQGGSVVIKCPDVSAIQGYHISMKRSPREIDNMLPRIGGEILERGYMPRRNITEADVEDRKRTIREEVVDLDNA